MRPRLVIEAGKGEPSVCNLDPDQVASLGRNRKNTIVLHDRHASRYHAEIVREEGHWVLRDRDTMNGTLASQTQAE
jgi:pSer/pThr/pTyr-binding forkhead associated (FHA) protein